MSSRPPDGEPFGLLGLDAGASADDIRRARNRLAKEAHPDVGGSAERMQAINRAAEAALAALDRPAPTQPSRRRGRSGDGRPSGGGRRPGPSRVERDHPSFTIEALPAEAFEALVLVANVLGDVADDEPPYRLEMILHDPRQVWCRAELVPDGGGSTVSLTVATPRGEVGPVPAESTVYDVRDRLLDELNALDWTPDGPKPHTDPTAH